jgi:hypothetical protein
MKIKAIVFVPGKPHAVKEYDSSESIFEEHHERRWGLTKKECSWELNREGFFICPLSDKRKKYTHGSFLLVPKADYYGEQVSTSNLIERIKRDLDAYDSMHMFETISNYIMSVERDSKLGDLGIE